MLKYPVSVSLVAILSIIVERIRIAIDDGLILMREDSLTTDKTPGRASLLRRAKLSVKPVFLSTSYHTSACIVRDLVNIVCVPV